MALNKKSILFITTQYRAGERIYPIIPYLAEDYTLDLLKVYHMHPQKGKWGGNQDLRKVFDQKYSKYFFNKFISVSDISNLSQYDLILVDLWWDSSDISDEQKATLQNNYGEYLNDNGKIVLPVTFNSL